MYPVFILLFLPVTAVIVCIVFLVNRVFLLAWAKKRALQYSTCPACHKVILLSLFMCDNCNRIHDLTPTDKSIFSLQCHSCGKRLSKIPQFGRDNLIAVCPNHSPFHYLLGKNASKYPEMLIPIVGGTSTGKSAFLAAWTVYAQQQLPRLCDVNVTFPFHDGPGYARDCLQRFQQGVTPAKTSITNPNGLGMEIASKKKHKGLRLFLYDPAGEVFDPLSQDSEHSLSPFEYYDYMDGALFMIDPFSTPVLSKKYSQSTLNLGGFEVSDKKTEDCCDKFIRGLQNHNLKHDEYHYAPCAIVITKADAFDLDSLIGKEAVRNKMAGNPRLSFEDALDEACSTQLKDWGLGHVLHLLRSNFKEVRCFSVSAYGRQANIKGPFTPERVELPILWLLNQRKSKLRLIPK